MYNRKEERKRREKEKANKVPHDLNTVSSIVVSEYPLTVANEVGSSF